MSDHPMCWFCGEIRESPCMNSRDVEASAESGDDCCLGVLERDRSLGEVGYDRIVARMGDTRKGGCGMSLAKAAEATRTYRMTWTRTQTGEKWIVCPRNSDSVVYVSDDSGAAQSACDHLNLSAALAACECDDAIWMEAAAIDAGTKLHLDPVTCLEVWDAMLAAMPKVIRSEWKARIGNAGDA